MNRYRSYSEGDDQPTTVGDDQFLGVDEYSAQENIKPGNVYQAINMDFQSQDVRTRGGFVCLPELGAEPFGTAWTIETVSGTTTWNSVVFGNNRFVAVGVASSGYGAVMTSIDGKNWTVQSVSGQPAFKDVSYGNGKFIAVGDLYGTATTGIRVSTDGVTWTAPASNSTSTNNSSVAYGNGKWACLSYEPSGTNWYVYSSADDGVTWTKTFLITQTGPNGNICYGNGKFVATVTFLIYVFYSTDAVSWSYTQISDPDPVGLDATDIVFGRGTFVLFNFNGSIWTSLNGTTWTRSRSPDGPGYISPWYVMIGSDQGFVASGSAGWGTLYSINTSQWIQSYNIGSGYYYGGTYGNGLYVFVGDSGAVAYSSTPIVSVFASSIYSDPRSVGSQWIMLVGAESVGFFQAGYSSRTVSLGGYIVSEQSTIVQCNNLVYLFRGQDYQPLYWDGDWNHSFALVPLTTPAAGFETIPYSNQATYYQNRLWVINGKDIVSASDVLDFNTYDQIANEFNINTGDSDYLVATFPFGENTLLAFKNKSILALNNVQGALTDVTVTEVTRQVGLIGINAVVSVGPDLAYVSNQNVNLITLTSTNNAVQHKTLPLSAKIQRIMRRVNWQYGYKISMGYLNNHLYIALPLDNSVFCNAVVAYNFITENWYGEWNFDASMNMCIQGWQVSDYLGLQRMHAITEDGRIFIVDEGQNDISGTTVAEISTTLVTRAYPTNNLNHIQRRLFIDMATNRPQFSVSVFTEGVSEETEVLSDQTYSRSQSWKFNDTPYDLTNANDDYNRAYRKDYSTGPDSVQCGSGFLPEATQELRLPIIARRQGRLSWLQVTNTQGYISIMSAGLETRPGQRSNLIQV